MSGIYLSLRLFIYMRSTTVFYLLFFCVGYKISILSLLLSFFLFSKAECERSLAIWSCHLSGTFPPTLFHILLRYHLSVCWHTTSSPATFVNNLTIRPATASHHSAPRSWHERDFCLMNLPTSLSRGYRGTRLDRKRLAREVMLSRWPPPLMSSALVPGGQGDWPRASRTAHSRSSGVRWSREAEISRYRQL